MTKTQNDKVIERVRKGHLRETKAHWKNALRSSPDRLRVAVNVALARTAKPAEGAQLDMFGTVDAPQPTRAVRRVEPYVAAHLINDDGYLLGRAPDGTVYATQRKA